MDTWKFIALTVLSILVGFGMGWVARYLFSFYPGNDQKLIQAQRVAGASQSRFRDWRLRCNLAESELKALNRAYDTLQRAYGNLQAENASMADLLKDLVSFNTCDLHSSQKYLAARVQHLKGCGLNLSQVQQQILGYRGGAGYYAIKRFYDGDVSMAQKVKHTRDGDEVELCGCWEGDRIADETV
jgi:hypothetical protein